jgi:hypothetical protein
MNEPRLPAALLAAVARDFEPVRPLARPGRRALAMVPLAIIFLVVLPELWNWRTHEALAPASSWWLSALETLSSLAVLVAAFREAVPGKQLSGRALVALVSAACVLFAVINLALRNPPGVDQALWVRWFWECIVNAAMFSAPALIAPAWLVSRALPNRPGLTGALCGLGIGLMADAGLRLICWDGDFLHVLVAHGGAILNLVALGALSATVVERLKARRLTRLLARTTT